MREKVELPINEIIEKYESGVSQIQLAKEYSISNNIIFKRISEYYQTTGKEKPRRVYAKKELPVEEIVKKYEAGISQAQLAKEYNVSDFAIRMRIAQYYQETGRERPEISSTKKEVPIEEIVIKYESGMLQSQLAEEYNVSNTIINTRIEEYNVSQSVICLRISEYYYETGKEKPERKKSGKKETNTYTKDEGKKLKELRSTTIIIDYLKKGLSIEDIIETASKRNVVIPQKLIDDALNKANIKNVTADNEETR